MRRPARRWAVAAACLAGAAVLAGSAAYALVSRSDGERPRPPAISLPDGAAAGPVMTPALRGELEDFIHAHEPRSAWARLSRAVATDQAPARALIASMAAATLRVGISDPDLYYRSPSAQAAEVADLKDGLHVNAVRVDVPWALIQPTNAATYDWAAMDQLVAAVRAGGLGIDFIIDSTPPWASSSGEYWAAPSDPAQYAAFAGAVAARYGRGGPSTFEIWNEPNLRGYWQPAADAAAYTRMLVDAAAAIRTVEPAATIITGGLSSRGRGIDPVAFLSAIYRDGGGSAFSAVGLHPYSYPLFPDDPGSAFAKIDAMRAVMVANGDASKPIDITEIGWPSNVPSTSGIAGPVAEAEEVVQILAFQAVTPWVQSADFFEYEDEGTSPTVEGFNFGMRTAAGVPKPAYGVLAHR